MVWPASLQRLIYGHSVSQRLGAVQWPASLQSLTFVTEYSQSLDAVVWRARRESLSRMDFNQSLDDMEWLPACGG